MALCLQQRVPIREGLLIYGGPGTGKSNAVCRMVLNMPHVRFHIVDNEIDSYEAIFYEDEAYAPVLARGISTTPDEDAPVTIYPVSSRDWEPQLAAAKLASAACGAGDWYVFDLLTPTWTAVQGWFTDKVYAADLESYFLQRREEVEQANALAREAAEKRSETHKDKRSFFALDGQNDYGKVINPQYNLIYETFKNGLGNTIMVCEEQQVDKTNSSNETKMNRNLFGDEGYRPSGQKSVGHKQRTVVHMTADKRGFYYSTLKDRGREKVDDVDYGEDFARSYFKGIAQWALKPYKEEASA